MWHTTMIAYLGEMLLFSSMVVIELQKLSSQSYGIGWIDWLKYKKSCPWPLIVLLIQTVMELDGLIEI